MKNIARQFLIPLLVLVGIFLYLFFSFTQQTVLGNSIVWLTVALGSYELFWETFLSLRKGHFALDYIAILAIVLSMVTGQYLVALILALMITSGRTLEDFGASQAKASLTQLADRIPDAVTIWEDGSPAHKKKLREVRIGEKIFIRKGEVIPLDGQLMAQDASIDESTLTGEPVFVEKIKGNLLRSGTINMGKPIVLSVIHGEKDSTYKKIVDMVRKAQDERSPLVRLADRYSTIFTIVTFCIALFAYIYSGFSLLSVLSVLAIATPCPLIIATPIALLGGVNAAAKKRIIVKHFASLEALARSNVIVFDKTGTITLGKPKVTDYENHTRMSERESLGISRAIEQNSLHPLAKAIVTFADEKNAQHIMVDSVHEELGKGITAEIGGKEYFLQGGKSDEGMLITLFEEEEALGTFRFSDEIKRESKSVIEKLRHLGLQIFIFTGDKKEAAEKIIAQLDLPVTLRAELSPAQKQEGIAVLKKQGKVTAMVGDGINDAPALALADVGMVFSNEEQTAATDAADIVFLGGDFTQVANSYLIARRTIQIAKQSILWGIGLSIIGMLLAAFGFIPPLLGAGLQELIDVAVILNALRAAK